MEIQDTNRRVHKREFAPLNQFLELEGKASIYANHYADEKGALDKVAGDLGYTGEEYVAGVSIVDWKAYKLIK